MGRPLRRSRKSVGRDPCGLRPSGLNFIAAGLSRKSEARLESLALRCARVLPGFVPARLPSARSRTIDAVAVDGKGVDLYRTITTSDGFNPNTINLQAERGSCVSEEHSNGQAGSLHRAPRQALRQSAVGAAGPLNHRTWRNTCPSCQCPRVGFAWR